MPSPTRPLLRRLAASLVVLRNTATGGGSGRGFEVLMVQRSRNMKFAKSTWVFPGGVFDKADGRAAAAAAHDGTGIAHANNPSVLETIALRECFEETGVLPIETTGSQPAAFTSFDDWKAWRRRVHDDATQWSALLQRGGGLVFSPTPALCCFETPQLEAERSRRQYLTHFLVCQVPRPTGDDAAPWHNADVDDNENVRALWVTPQAALAALREGKMPMFPPQFYILQRLCAFASAESALAHARWFCPRRPAGGRNQQSEATVSLVMQPEFQNVLVLPFDEQHVGLPGKKGNRHRIEGFGRRSKGGMRLTLNAQCVHQMCGPDVPPEAWVWEQQQDQGKVALPSPRL